MHSETAMLTCRYIYVFTMLTLYVRVFSCTDMCTFVIHFTLLGLGINVKTSLKPSLSSLWFKLSTSLIHLSKNSSTAQKTNVNTNKIRCLTSETLICLRLHSHG